MHLRPTPETSLLLSDSISLWLETSVRTFFSNRYGRWHKDKAEQGSRNIPRIIVFIVGGISLNEARAAYEVTKERSSWEVIIGKRDDADDTLVNDDCLQEETLQPSPRLTS